MKGVVAGFVLVALLGTISAQGAEKDIFNDLTKLFSKSIVIRADLTIPEQKSTSHYEEFHDEETGIHSVQITGATNTTIVYYEKGRKFVKVQDGCEVKDATNVTKDDFMLFASDPNQRYFYLGMEVIFRRLESLKPTVDINVTQHRGVEVIKLVMTSSDFVYDAIVSESPHGSDPNGPDTLKYFPLAIVEMDVLTNDRFIYEIYEINANPNMLDYYKKLQIPEGVMCVNLTGDAFKVPMNEYSYVEEASGSQLEGLWYEKVFADPEINLVRFITDDHDEIHDLRAGVLYDMTSEGCTVKNLATAERGQNAVIAEHYFNNLIFYPTYYIGRELVRGIVCDVYGAVAPENFRNSVARKNDILLRYYISTDVSLFDTDDVVSKKIPLRISLQEIKDNLTESDGPPFSLNVNLYEFYETKDESRFSSNFDISDCIPRKVFIQIMFSVHPTVDKYAMTPYLESVIPNKIKEVITETANISRLRVPSVDVVFEDENIVLATVKLLDRTDPLASFAKKGTVHKGEKMVSMKARGNAADCAAECIRDVGCKTFFQCDDNLCFKSASENLDDWHEGTSGNCTVYINEAYNNGILDRTIEELQDYLQASISQLTFHVTDNAMDSEFTAIHIKSNLEPFDVRDKGAPYRLMVRDRKYNALNVFDTRVVDDLSNVATAADCYRECKKVDDFDCVGFSMCPNRPQKCILSSIYLSMTSEKTFQMNDTEEDSDCNIYSMNYMRMFDKASGSVEPVEDAVPVEKASTAEGCAFLCKNNIQGPCRSFDYCPTSKRCFVYEKHQPTNTSNNEGETTVKEKCSRYSLKFKSDYMNVGHEVIVDPKSSAVSDVNEEQCAKLCSENSGDCKSFNYCPNEHRCEMNTVTYMDGDVKIATNEKCNLFIRDVTLDEVIKPKNRGRPVIDTGSGVRGGGLAALLIFMLVIGMAIGTLLMVYYPTIRSRIAASRAAAGPGPTIAYSTQRDEV